MIDPREFAYDFDVTTEDATPKNNTIVITVKRKADGEEFELPDGLLLSMFMCVKRHFAKVDILRYADDLEKYYEPCELTPEQIRENIEDITTDYLDAHAESSYEDMKFAINILAPKRIGLKEE